MKLRILTLLLSLFAGFLLASRYFAGDAALLFGARGGVYLGGGIAPKIALALSSGAYRTAFEQKGRMTAYLAPIPRLRDPCRLCDP